MKKPVVPNIMLKLVALVLAIITWFYISVEMRRSTLGPGTYTTNPK